MNGISFISENAYAQQLSAITRELDRTKTVFTVVAEDGCSLYGERYDCENSRGTIVIVHGFTEFSEKYKETIWYFREVGYRVVIYDQRGHGLSDRIAEDPMLVHVEKFEDYVTDLHAVIAQQVLPFGDGPIYLYAHSMGGAVSLLYMAAHPQQIQRAVLSSPMVAPYTQGMPCALVLQACRRDAEQNGWTSRFRYMRDFNPHVKFENTQDASYARFRANLDLRIRTPQYQAACATNRWMWECLRLKKQLLSASVTSLIVTPILLFSAEKDATVKTKPQRQLAKRLKHCRFVSVAGAKHNLFSVSGEPLETYFRAVLEFLEQ